MLQTPSTQQYHEQMQVLRKDYLNRLKKSLRDVRRMRELMSKNLAPVKDLQELLRLSHNLNGSGATFGFPDISHKAGKLHQTLKEMIDGRQFSRMDDAERQVVLDNLDDFYEISRQTINQHGASVSTQTSSDTDTPETRPLKTVAVLARKENAFYQSVKESTVHQTLFVNSFQTLRSTPQVDLIIISNDLASADETFLKETLDSKKILDLPAPFLITLKHEEIEAKMEAIRLGAAAYISSRADDKTSLTTLLSRFLKDGPTSSLTGAVIAKDTMLSGFYEHALQRSGLYAQIIPAKDFSKNITSSDFFIVDFETPWGKGADMITILQHEKHRRAIIFFLCTKDEYNSLDTVPSCITLLLKPFSPEYLIKIIAKTLALDQI